MAASIPSVNYSACKLISQNLNKNALFPLHGTSFSAIPIRKMLKSRSGRRSKATEKQMIRRRSQKCRRWWRRRRKMRCSRNNFLSHSMELTGVWVPAAKPERKSSSWSLSLNPKTRTRLRLRLWLCSMANGFLREFLVQSNLFFL